MKGNWKIVKLENVIKYRNDFISINDLQKYKLCRVQTKVQGVVLREEKKGFEIKTKKQQICKTNDLIFAEMDARFGGYGIIPIELDGALVSSHYFLYEIDNTAIDKIYLNYCLKQPWFLSQVEAKGSTNYAAIRPYQVLEYEIPLPSLSEQKRIVEKIESIQKRVEQIRKLRAEQEKEIKNLRNIIFQDLQKTQKIVAIGSVLTPHKEIVQLNAEESYRQITVKMEHKGVLLRGVTKGKDIGSKQFLAKEGNYIISKIDARNGAMGIIPKELNGAIVTNDFPLYSFSKDINSKYFNYFSNTFFFDNACKQASEGSTNRKRLKIDKYENIQIPLPSIAEQNRIVSFLGKINQIRQTFKAQETELTNLLPSLLDKAFKGELFEEEKAKVIPFVKSSKLESQYFVKRKMLATFIINQSLDDEQFGDTKFEKILYLADCWAIQRNLNQQYYKKPAGPYDNRFTYNFYDQITKDGWFDIQKIPNAQSKITAGGNNDKSRKDYGYFSAEELTKVNHLLGLFKKSDYRVPEVVSTLYAVWNNRIILKQEISDEILIRDFYDWDKHKSVYTKSQVENSLNWMREKGLVPDGWGEVIEKAEKKTTTKK